MGIYMQSFGTTNFYAMNFAIYIFFYIEWFNTIPGLLVQSASWLLNPHIWRLSPQVSKWGKPHHNLYLTFIFLPFGIFLGCQKSCRKKCFTVLRFGGLTPHYSHIWLLQFHSYPTCFGSRFLSWYRVHQNDFRNESLSIYVCN